MPPHKPSGSGGAVPPAGGFVSPHLYVEALNFIFKVDLILSISNSNRDLVVVHRISSEDIIVHVYKGSRSDSLLFSGSTFCVSNIDSTSPFTKDFHHSIWLCFVRRTDTDCLILCRKHNIGEPRARQVEV